MKSPNEVRATRLDIWKCTPLIVQIPVLSDPEQKEWIYASKRIIKLAL